MPESPLRAARSVGGTRTAKYSEIFPSSCGDDHVLVISPRAFFRGRNERLLVQQFYSKM